MSTQWFTRVFLAFLVSAILAFTGCGGSGSNGNGTLNLSITDTPVDGATSVIVAFTGVEIQPAGSVQSGNDMDSDDQGGDNEDQGDMSDTHDMEDDQGSDDGQGANANSGGMGGGQRLTFNFDTPHKIDLLQQQNGASAALLSGVSLPAGHYEWIRLMVDAADSSITLTDGSVHPLVIPSGAETGLKLVHGFDVAQGGIVSFTIDFDLRKSITLAHGKYILKPAMRIMDNLDVGNIDGSSSNTLTIGALAISDPACMPAAYIYAGANVTPVDIDPNASVQPVTSVALHLDSGTGDYVFTADFLAPGDYTVALACGALDDPSMSDSLAFSAAKDVTVTADGTTDVVFP